MGHIADTQDAERSRTMPRANFQKRGSQRGISRIPRIPGQVPGRLGTNSQRLCGFFRGYLREEGRVA